MLERPPFAGVPTALHSPGHHTVAVVKALFHPTGFQQGTLTEHKVFVLSGDLG